MAPALRILCMLCVLAAAATEVTISVLQKRIPKQRPFLEKKLSPVSQFVSGRTKIQTQKVQDQNSKACEWQPPPVFLPRKSHGQRGLGLSKSQRPTDGSPALKADSFSSEPPRTPLYSRDPFPTIGGAPWDRSSICRGLAWWSSDSNAEGAGSIPSQGTKILHASQPKNHNIKQK